VATSIELTTVVCPGCGRERSVSARTARRGAGKCRWCLAGDGHIERPDDTDRVYWLERFTDDDLCELATIIFCRPGSVRRIRAERKRLLVAHRVGERNYSPSATISTSRTARIPLRQPLGGPHTGQPSLPVER
jgi:hypothetical protein